MKRLQNQTVLQLAVRVLAVAFSSGNTAITYNSLTGKPDVTTIFKHFYYTYIFISVLTFFQHKVLQRRTIS